MKILLLTRYGRQGASSRLRALQFLPYLKASGIDVTHTPLLSDNYLTALYDGGTLNCGAVLRGLWNRLTRLATLGRHDLVWVENEVIPWVPYFLAHPLMRGRPIVMDFDDAWFHRYDRHPNPVVRMLLGRSVDSAMRHATIVFAGNEYIRARGRGGCGSS